METIHTTTNDDRPVNPGSDPLSSENLIEFETNEMIAWAVQYRTHLNPAMTFEPAESRYFGHVFAGALPGQDILAFNRVMGLGLREPVTGNLLEKINRFYRDAGVKRIFLPVYPFTITPEINRLLQTHGFEPYNHWVKLWRPLGNDLPLPAPGLDVVTVGADAAPLFCSIVAEAFSFPPGVANRYASTFDLDGYRHYLVYHNNTPVAAGALYVRGIYASMALAGTLPAYRGLGAQSTLLAHRLREARKEGCSFAISETSQDLPDRPVPSYRNMIRAGFRIVYIRPNYIQYLVS
jgi:GNAT superfamily N-acetyltransferase